MAEYQYIVYVYIQEVSSVAYYKYILYQLSCIRCVIYHVLYSWYYISSASCILVRERYNEYLTNISCIWYISCPIWTIRISSAEHESGVSNIVPNNKEIYKCICLAWSLVIYYIIKSIINMDSLHWTDIWWNYTKSVLLYFQIMHEYHNKKIWYGEAR